MKKVAFLPYSTPFKWITNTNIAHNKIWSWLIMEMSAHGGYEMTVLSDVDRQTLGSIGKYGCQVGKLTDQEFLVVFCGYYTPVVPGSSIIHALKTIRDFHGTVLYVTCDYLLQFNPTVKRYGKLLADWPEDSFSEGKQWRYIMNSTPEYHFKTPAALQKFQSFPNLEYHLSIPDLNMAGIDPSWESRTVSNSLRHGTMYCGAFRPDREDFFRRYFCQPESSGFVVSSSCPEKFRKLDGFRSTACDPVSGRIWGAISTSWTQVIGCDEVDSHSPGTPLPTRFWEAVSAQVPVFFDQVTCGRWECLKTMGIPARFVDSAKSLKVMISRMERNKALRSFIAQDQLELLKGISLYDQWNVQKWFA